MVHRHMKSVPCSGQLLLFVPGWWLENRCFFVYAFFCITFSKHIDALMAASTTRLRHIILSNLIARISRPQQLLSAAAFSATELSTFVFSAFFTAVFESQSPYSSLHACRGLVFYLASCTTSIVNLSHTEDGADGRPRKHILTK